MNKSNRDEEKRQKRIVIVGASSAMAKGCARLWLKEGPLELILVGRNQDRMKRVARDLRIRNSQAHIHQVVLADFSSPSSIQKTVDEICEQGPVDVVLIAHGFLPKQSHCQRDLQMCRETLEVNGISPVLYAEAFIHKMEAVGKGVVTIIGSVAGDRGRQSNYVYGSAKGLVEIYVQGLQHRLVHTGVKVILVKPGPTDTPMTAELKVKGVKLESVGDVVGPIVKAIRRGRSSVVYTPSKWRWIMWVIRNLPSFVFHRMNI